MATPVASLTGPFAGRTSTYYVGFIAGRKNGQDARWLQQVRRSGTTSDKIAALTLLLQESAVANLRSLDALLNWVIKRKGGRNVVAQVCSPQHLTHSDWHCISCVVHQLNAVCTPDQRL